jgi:hypothetical protein
MIFQYMNGWPSRIDDCLGVKKPLDSDEFDPHSVQSPYTIELSRVPAMRQFKDNIFFRHGTCDSAVHVIIETVSQFNSSAKPYREPVNNPIVPFEKGHQY